MLTPLDAATNMHRMNNAPTFRQLLTQGLAERPVRRGSLPPQYDAAGLREYSGDRGPIPSASGHEWDIGMARIFSLVMLED